LKMDTTGKLLPEERRFIYSPVPGEVIDFRVIPNEQIGASANLVFMYEHDLELKLLTLEREIRGAEGQLKTLEAQEKRAPENEKARIASEIQNQRTTRDAKTKERDLLMERTHSAQGQPGYYWLQAPAFAPGTAHVEGEPLWTVLNADFRENLKGKPVKPSDPILRLGNKRGHWELEMKIPQKHIGQVLAALKNTGKDVLDVDVRVRSDPTRVFKGKLHRDDIAAEGNPEKDERNEQEPMVLATVRLEDDGIPDNACLP